MYMQHERHSDSDPNSRHQQTEASHMRDHWKPSKSQQSQQSDRVDPHDKPSQTAVSFLQKHHTPKNPESKANPDDGASCSCTAKRSKSADPPAVKAHTCACNTDPSPCGLGHQEKSSSRKPCSQKTSVTEPEKASSFKSAITACTKELLDPCTCGAHPPYWAGQSNLVTGPSYSRAMDPSSSTLAPLHRPGASKGSFGRSKSLASLPSKSNPPTQSGVTWLSALKDPESTCCSSKEDERPACTCNATQTNQDPSMSSLPQSHPNYRSMTSKSSNFRAPNPRNQPSFGPGDETSATTRSQSIVGQVTCLCASEHQPTKAFVSSLADRECPNEIQIAPCPSTRIHHPSGFAQFTDCQNSQGDPSTSFRSRKVSVKGQEEFCDCDASDNFSELSDPIQTSLHTHRSLSGGSCLCNDDADPPKEPEKATCVSKQCQCSSNDELQGMQSAQAGTGYQTPEDLCGNRAMACCSRKERILMLMEKLTSPGCDCGISRPCLTQQLFRELTLLLRSEKDDAVAPADEASPPCLTFDECCTAQHAGNGEGDPVEKPPSKRELQRVECFHQLEEYLCKCFLPPAEPQIPETDIYAFELDPDFPPEPEPKSPKENDNMQPCQCPEQFFDIGNALTCSGDGLDDDFFRDCEDDEEVKKFESKDDGKATTEPDLCQSLKAFIDKELQEILAEEANKEGEEVEEKTPSTVLREICERPTTVASPEEEEKPEQIECPFAGMVSCPPWTTQQTDWAAFPYNLDPCAQKESPSPAPRGPRTGLLPEGPLSPDMRNLCEQLLRKALKDCGLCGGDDVYSCEDDVCEECALNCEECPEDCPLEKCEECDDECPPEQQGCLCCHCRALICDEECKTVANTLRSGMCDPLCEMKYFIDSIIVDMHAMDCVLGNKKAKPKHLKATDSTNRGGPGDSFPVKIKSVWPLGNTALYVQWQLEDCRAVAGYEIYLDGHLTNRFYSFRHEAGVITNADVTNPHQVVVRAVAVGQEFPGEGPGKDATQECGCQAVALAHPELKAGAQRPWSPSLYYYDPNQLPPAEDVQPC